MSAELGHFALTLAFAVALFQVVVPLVMALGGLVSLTDRRYRGGAAVRRRRAAPVAAE